MMDRILPPLVLGGQGRTSRSIIRDATSWVECLGYACIIAGVLLWLLP